MSDVVLEPALMEFAGVALKAPFIDELLPDPDEAPPIDEQWVTVTAAAGDVRVRVVRPRGATAAPPVVLYVGAAVVFVAYPPSPDAHYPTVIEQIYATTRWIVVDGASHGLDASRPAIAGDSEGGDLTTAMTIMAKQRGDARFMRRSMNSPVIDAGQATDGYAKFNNGPYLAAKSWPGSGTASPRIEQ